VEKENFIRYLRGHVSLGRAILSMGDARCAIMKELYRRRAELTDAELPVTPYTLITVRELGEHGMYAVAMDGSITDFPVEDAIVHTGSTPRTGRRWWEFWKRDVVLVVWNGWPDRVVANVKPLRAITSAGRPLPVSEGRYVAVFDQDDGRRAYSFPLRSVAAAFVVRQAEKHGNFNKANVLTAEGWNSKEGLRR